MNKDAERIMIAMQQIENVLSMIEGNEWEGYMNLRLTTVYYELRRQLEVLTNRNGSDKMNTTSKDQ